MSVTFSRNGWKQLERLNRYLETRYLKAFILQRELEAFLQAHEGSTRRLDTICQELHYENGVYLLLRRTAGEWIITDIWYDGQPATFEPIFIWRCIRRGCKQLLERALACWRAAPLAVPLA